MTANLATKKEKEERKRKSTNTQLGNITRETNYMKSKYHSLHVLHQGDYDSQQGDL